MKVETLFRINLFYLPNPTPKWLLLVTIIGYYWLLHYYLLLILIGYYIYNTYLILYFVFMIKT